MALQKQKAWPRLGMSSKRLCVNGPDRAVAGQGRVLCSHRAYPKETSILRRVVLVLISSLGQLALVV